MEDDVGVWVTFDVPEGHYLHEMFVPVDREALPAHIPVQRVQGRVLGGTAKPDVHQMREAMWAMQQSMLPERFPEKKRPPTPSKTSRNKDVQFEEDTRDAQLASLREELAKAKAALQDSSHKPTAGGDAHATTKSRSKKVQYETEHTSAYDTEAELREVRRAMTDAREPSQSEYTTCAEEHPSEYVGEDGRIYHRRRKSRAERRMSSRSGTPELNTKTTQTQEMMRMFQECMKATLATVIETREKIKSGDDGEVKSSMKPSTQVPSPSENTSEAAQATQVPSYHPMMAGHPHLTISKFTGENWTEFIEYFESVADANAWSEKDRLTYLLMSIDSKPRMYARGDSGTQQTYFDVRRRLQQRYGQNEPAFSVRAQLREIQRKPGERLEVFADRLQEVAQRGVLDPQDRD